MPDERPSPRPEPLSEEDREAPAGDLFRSVESPYLLPTLRGTGAFLPLLFLLLAAGCHPAGDSSSMNRLPVTVGEATGGRSHSPADINIPTVSAKVCLRNVLERCFTVRRLLLDTGSSGLRIFPSAIPTAQALPAPLLQTSSLWECLPFGTAHLWGRVVPADVTLGGEPAVRDLSIQIVGRSPFSHPPPCGRENGRSLSGIDGILGVSPGRVDGGAYFECSEPGCRPVAPSPGEAIANPVMRAESDNNGIVLRFPGIPKNGTGPIMGELLLGVGTARDNRLPPGVRFFPMDRDGFFRAKTGRSSRLFYGRLDTGTTALVLPDQKMPACSPPLSNLACPDRETSISIFIPDRQGEDRKIPVQVGNAAERLREHRSLAGDILYFSPETSSPPFILGMPFFFGKTLYLLYLPHSPGNNGEFACRC